MAACAPSDDKDPILLGDDVMPDTVPVDTDVDTVGVDTDPVVDTEVDTLEDTGDTEVDTDVDTVPVDTDPTGDTGTPVQTAADLGVGDLLITEVMISPLACPSTDAQYIEALYQGADPVDLIGLQIEDNLGSWTLNTHHLVQPGDHVILWRAPGVGSQCYSFTQGVEWPQWIGFSVGADHVTLRNPTFLIDQVDWTGWTIPEGASLSLDPSVVAAAANDVESAWCPAVGAVSGTSDQGTPGAANAACGSVIPNPTPTPTDTGDTGAVTPTPGSGLVLSEIGDPVDYSLRFVEVYNASSSPVDLSDWQIERFANGSTSGSGSVALGPGTLAPGDTWVIARTGADAGDFAAATGGGFDQTHQSIDGNGDDVYVLSSAGITVDVYGQVGQGGGPWEYENIIVSRLDCANAARTSWVAADWALDMPGSAGQHPSPAATCSGTPPTPTPTPTPVHTADTGDTGTVTPPPSGPTGLVLSQVVDWGPDYNLRFVEVANMGATAVDLSAYEIWRYSNGDSTPSATGGTTPIGTATLQPGEVWVVGSQGGQGDFAATFGVEPDAYSPTITGNGDDVYALVLQGTVVDVFGVIGVDGTGEPWQYEDMTATRDPSITVQSATFAVGDWAISGDPSAPTLGTHP